MKRTIARALGRAVLSAVLLGWPKPAAQAATQGTPPLTRIAEIEIDPQQVEAYKAALREGITAALRLEPGVLSISAVSVKGHPEQVRIFEVYASQQAYEAHLQTSHFRKYKAATQSMVRSLKLIDTEPIFLEGKH